MSYASDLLERHIVSFHERQRLEKACQAICETDFIRSVAVHTGADYRDVEQAFDLLGANVHALVNSPSGRCLLANALTGASAPLMMTAIN